MKVNKIYISSAFLSLLLPVFNNLHADIQTFNFTGGIQTYTVATPAAHTKHSDLFIQAWGGQGGSGAVGGNSSSGGAGGLAGYAEGKLAAAPGTVLNIIVGGQGSTPTGGFNGGANGGSQNAGGGGGASDVRVGGTAEANRILVAGGGGGGGRGGCESSSAIGGAGGSGGGGSGANGTDAATSGGVAGGGKGGNFGGVQGQNGAAGAGCSGFLGSPGTTASTGTGGSGGAGQSCCCFNAQSIPAGGGGGGGFLGGGGGGGGSAGTTGCSGDDKGGGGGGGGGSSYTGGVIEGATNAGIWLGNGMVNITYDVIEAGITVTPVSGLTTNEGGGTAEFTVVLNAAPTENVTIAISSDDTTEGTLSISQLVFTAGNWNTPQTVTVTGANDNSIDGPQTYHITFGAVTSNDAFYDGLDVSGTSVELSNQDNDTAGVTVNPTSGLTTNEAGTEAEFTVVLNTQPTQNVQIPVSSTNNAEGLPDVSTLTFTNANWNTPQTVTATGQNDTLIDGNVAYSIVLGAAVSDDTDYAGLNPNDVSLTNSDNDVAGVTVAAGSGLTTTEVGGTAQFTVVLNATPSANVVIPVSSSDTTEGTVSAAALTFTAANWNTPQTVTVTGVDDTLMDGSIAYTVQLGAVTSSDTNFNGLDPSDVSVTNTDNDQAVTPTPTATASATPSPSGSASASPTPSNPNNVKCRSLTATIVGTNGDDVITGTAGNDVIAGLDGNDTINGAGGDDIICGGAGNDKLKGDAGNDKLYGEAGNDKLTGGTGRDRCSGGSGKGDKAAKSCEVVRAVP